MRFFVPITTAAAVILLSIISCEKRAIQADPVAISQAKPPVVASQIGRKLDSTQRQFFAEISAEEARIEKLSKTTMKPLPVAISASEAIHANRVPQ